MTNMAHSLGVTTPREAELSRWWRSVDKVSFALLILLFIVGVALALAASVPLAERNGLPQYYYVKRQAVFGLATLAVIFMTAIISPNWVRRLGIVGFFIALIALMCLPLLGTDYGKGAVRWYSTPFGSLQPSEFIKPLFVVFTAWMMSSGMNGAGIIWRGVSFLSLSLVVFILIMQPDYGQASLLVFAWTAIYIVAGANWLFIAALGAILVAVGMIAYANSEHVAGRIDAFLSPDLSPYTQLSYAHNAIQEGGWWGVGIGQGESKWHLPDAHTDFIIAVVAEEFGLFVVCLILLLFSAITWLSFMRIMKESNNFMRLAATGLISLFFIQCFINFGVTMRLLPAKGMTLPFISYGGSSLLAFGLTFGMLFAFTRLRPQNIFSGGQGLQNRTIK
ncbi:MAG: FtsW/RodA/SpoVE family cell cycle protein [Candidatus Halichondribacter symbioticus]